MTITMHMCMYACMHMYMYVCMSMPMDKAGTLTMATASNKDEWSTVGYPHTRLPLSSATVSNFLRSRDETNSAAR